MARNTVSGKIESNQFFDRLTHDPLNDKQPQLHDDTICMLLHTNYLHTCAQRYMLHLNLHESYMSMHSIQNFHYYHLTEYLEIPSAFRFVRLTVIIFVSRILSLLTLLNK